MSPITKDPAPTPNGFTAFTGRRQSIWLLWSIAGILALLMSYAIALELERQGQVTYQFPRTVLWCVLPYALASYWLYQGDDLPAFERRSFLSITTSLPFLLAPLGFALAQHPYSRGAVLLVYGLTTCTFLAGYGLFRPHRPLQLLYLDVSTPSSLQKLLGNMSIEQSALHLSLWNEYDSNTLHEHWDGVILDREAPANHTRSKRILWLKQHHVRLYSVESVAELLSGRKFDPASHPDGIWELNAQPAYDIAKRILDLSLTLLTLPLWIPMCVIAGLLVKWDSAGPILFSQTRVGRHGRSFRLWKIRTMRFEPKEQVARFAECQDTRVTRIGRFLRRSRLDELPQLWNVLRGEMSLIGPRPEQLPFVQEFAQHIPAYPYRHLVRPGLTGWAQVQQGYAADEEQTSIKLSYDLYYVTHYSLALDLLIACKTARIVLSGFGAR
jgi:lipopolysaccharide/colanic/teichoic acid biosynthesis glycosyltransferase